MLASTNLFFDHFKRLPYTGRNTSTLNCHQRQHSLINQLAPNRNEIKIYAYYKKSPRKILLTELLCNSQPSFQTVTGWPDKDDLFQYDWINHPVLMC